MSDWDKLDLYILSVLSMDTIILMVNDLKTSGGDTKLIKHIDKYIETVNHDYDCDY